MPSWFPALASILLAALPVIVWINIIHRQGEEKSLYVKTFLAGTLSVIPPFILIILFDKVPSLDIYAYIKETVADAALAAVMTNVVVGIVEEIAKNVIVRVIDKRHPEYIQTITSALKLSICAGLGFSFAENIFYFYNIWVDERYGAADLFSTFIFRSLFTMCGHMIFSGIFGYYFGIGKFAADETEFARWEQKISPLMWLARLVSKMTGKLTIVVVRELNNLKGLLLAMGLHATFNASLDMEHKLPSIMVILISSIYIAYLFQTRSGHLFFSMTKRKASTMAARDEDVVLELLGMWTREGKYKEVNDICDRLLQRDPFNNVVKMFKAKAADNEKMKKVFTSLKAVFEKNKEAQTTPQIAGTLLNINDEKVVLELMETWFKEEKYKEVLDIANRLLERNPQSQGAKLLIGKAIDKQKVEEVFNSLSKLFKD